MSNHLPALISIAGHESNLDKTAKLEWPIGGQVLRGAVYSVRQGYVALFDNKAFEGHFATLAEAKDAAQGKGPDEPIPNNGADSNEVATHQHAAPYQAGPISFSE